MSIWKDRILSALLAVAVTGAATAAIWRFAPEKPLFTEGQLRSGITYEATGVAPDAVIATLEGNTAPAELLTYQIGYSCSYLNYMLQAYGGRELDLNEELPGAGDARSYILQQSLDLVKQQLLVENLAEKYGVTLSEAEEAELAADRESYIAELGEEGFRTEVYRLGLSEEGYERMMRANYLYQALYNSYSDPGSALYASDDVLHAYAAGQGYITVDHILIPSVDLTTREPLDEETVGQNRAQAEELLSQLRESEDPIARFKELADQYSQDTGRASYPDGYTFTSGAMVQEFEDAAYALGENEISEIVESPYGFHILLRKPLDVSAAADAVREEYFDAFILGEKDRAEMQVSPTVEQMSVDAIYDALRAAQSAGQEDTGALDG